MSVVEHRALRIPTSEANFSRLAVDVAQLVEQRFVVPLAGGSSPLVHPIIFPDGDSGAKSDYALPGRLALCKISSETLSKTQIVRARGNTLSHFASKKR